MKKKFAVAILVLVAFIGGVIGGIKLTIDSAVLIESSKWHYGISYLNNEVEVYYTW